MRALRYLLLSLTAVLVLLVLGLFVLTSHPAGFVWLVEQGTPRVPGKLVVDEPGGDLLRGVSARRLSYSLPPLELEAEDLQLRLSWPALAAGVVRLARVDAQRLLITVQPDPDTPESDKSEPAALPEVSLPFPLQIVRARITEFQLQTGGIDERLTQVELRAAMRGSRLRIRELRALGRDAQATLNGQLQFTGNWPLNAELDWTLQNQQLAISGTAQATGDLARLELQQRIQVPDLVDTLQSNAVLFDLLDEPRLEATAEWNNFRWPLNAEAGTELRSARGTLRFNGTPENYSVALDTAAVVPQLPALELNLQGTGDTGQLQISTLELRGLVQTVSGSGQLDWRSGELLGSDLQLRAADNRMTAAGRLWPQPELSFTLAAEALEQLLSNAGGQLQATGSVSDRGGKPALAAELAGSNLYFDNYDAEQSSTERSGVESSDTQRLSAQNLTAKLQWDAATPSLAATVSGRGLRFDDYGIATLSAELQWRAEGPLGLQLDATDLSTGIDPDALQAAKLSASVTGTTGQHEYQLSWSGAPATGELSGTGSLDGSRWRGQLGAARIEQAMAGAWQLEAPAGLAVTRPESGPAVQLTVDAHCWNSEPARLCMAASRIDTEIDSRLQLSGLPLERFAGLWDPGLQLSGSADADIVLAGTLDSPAISAELELQNTQLAHRSLVDNKATTLTAFSEARARAELAADEVRFTATLRGDSNLRLQLSGGSSWPLQADAELSGELDASLDDFSALAPLLLRYGGLELTDGELRADFDVAGTLGDPALSGNARLSNAGATVAVAGIAVSDVQFEVRGRGREPLQISGRAESGGGQVALEGTLDLLNADRQPSARLQLLGNDFQVLRFPEQQVYASPALQALYENGRVQVTGRVTIPRADIKVKELPQSAVKPSPDVVVVQDDTTAADAGLNLPIDSRIEVVLGEQVSLEAFGLSTGLSGALRMATQADNPEPEVEGTLRSVDGNFEAFGQELSIERGTLIFTGALDRPFVDVRATRSLRYQGQAVKVGVLLSGPIDNMQSRLFGEPAMGESDALAYLLLGRPLRRTDSLAGSELSGAAVALGLVNLLPGTQKLGDTLGLDEISVEGTTEASSAVVAGKRLGEDFYVRYAYGLFDRIGTFIVRYNIGRGLSLEAGSGEEQTINLLYSIDR